MTIARLRYSFLSLCLAIGSAPVHAQENAFARIELADKLQDHELAQQRGGFRWGGVEINFGAELRTYIDGKLVLQTNLAWREDGVQTSRFVSESLTEAEAHDLKGSIVSGESVSLKLGGQQVFLANQGKTALIHADGTIQNIIVNTASGVDLRQEVDASLDLAGFVPFQKSLTEERLGSALASIITTATVPLLRD